MIVSTSLAKVGQRQATPQHNARSPYSDRAFVLPDPASNIPPNPQTTKTGPQSVPWPNTTPHAPSPVSTASTATAHTQNSKTHPSPSSGSAASDHGPPKQSLDTAYKTSPSSTSITSPSPTSTDSCRLCRRLSEWPRSIRSPATRLRVSLAVLS